MKLSQNEKCLEKLKVFQKPLILINFKNYKETIGDKALKLAREIAKVKRAKYDIAIAPSLLSIKEVTSKVKIPVFAQHTDPITTGAHTGSVSVLELKQLRVTGTLLNHSEKKVLLPILKETIELCKQNKLKTVVCVSKLSEIKKIANFHPDFIAYEPKELIGSDISVTQAKPKIITKAVQLVKKISPKTGFLCGAGVHSKEDIGQSLLLGAEGVLIGHAVPKAREPKRFLEEMLI